MGRPPLKQRAILADLRRKIVSGVYPPGSRLPTRLELHRHYQASLATVQVVLDRLARDGFVTARGRQGTHVVDNPPHLSTLALLFPRLEADASFSRNWSSLAKAAREHNAAQARRPGGFRFDLRFGYGARAGRPDVVEGLESDLADHLFAGLIFASTMRSLKGSPLLATPRVPRVAFIAIHPDEAFPHLARIQYDIRQMTEQVFALFAGQGRRRLAVINTDVHENALNGQIASIAAGFGLELPPYRHLLSTCASAKGIRNTAHLLLRLPEGDRPDCIFVAHDDLVESATLGFLDAGAHALDGVSLAVHCNFPDPAPQAVPAIRIGFDARAAMERAMEEIRHQAAGNPPRDSVLPSHIRE
ncbi:MAG: GntR family transcriptional regulator [Kiritimatiellia bacterium]